MFSFLIGFLSSFSLPFSRFLFCVSFAVSSSRSLSLPPSTVSLSFLTFLPMLCSLFVFGFLFLPPSPLPSFPYPSSSFSFPLWFILLSPLDPLSRLLSQFSVPFLLRLSFRSFLLCPLPKFLSSSFVYVSFPLPSSSLHAASSSFWSILSPL